MDFNHETFRPFRDGISDRGNMAPREAVAAIFAFGTPTSLITKRDRETSAWTLVATTAGGLAVVTATSSSDRWEFSSHDTPSDAQVDAAWYPLDRVSAVRLDSPTTYRPDFNEGGTMYLSTDYIIEISGRPDPIRLAKSQEAEKALVDEMVADIISRRSQSLV